MEVWVGLLVGWLSGLLGCLCLWWWCFFQQSYRIHQICLISSVSFTMSVVGFFSFTSDSFFFFPSLSRPFQSFESHPKSPKEAPGTPRYPEPPPGAGELQLFLQLGSPAVPAAGLSCCPAARCCCSAGTCVPGLSIFFGCHL